MAAGEKVTMVIDCDAGIDDAVAIMIALSQPNVDLIGITCVNGNTAIDNVTVNVLRVLQTCQRLEIPVYRGATKDFLGTASQVPSPHGIDGLGDAPNLPPPPSCELVKSEHAVLSLMRMVNERPHQVTLLALGPLTNIALAMRLDPDFTSKLKELIVMGGNILATGTRFPISEFNFTTDPSAAHIVVSETQCPTTIIPLETCLAHSVSCDWFESLQKRASSKAKFVSAIYSNTVTCCRSSSSPTCMVADGCAILAALRKTAIKESALTPCKVELHEGPTKGQMVTTKIFRWWAKSFPGPEINVIREFDMETYYQLLADAIS